MLYSGFGAMQFCGMAKEVRDLQCFSGDGGDGGVMNGGGGVLREAKKFLLT